MSTNISCPTRSQPADLPIPGNITYAVIPGTNTSSPWMKTCCAPNPVHLVNDCWLWCEITSNMTSFDITDPDGGGKTSDANLGAFDFCLTSMKRPTNESMGTGWHVAGAGSYRASAGGSVKAAAFVIFLSVAGVLF
ncbi:hypothetical protein N0V93_008249 [Gnomoniopsis smithogilvyi]|uniref:Uncharacterized protein n=1 Tax=Gnomoniopsis smithogilvyi TaxID=1191159 RepID=A0A9W8YLM3_9PEZI|nr:hypothetical protein N0V93_008249 [Gnomoniopsis smithogilvyi]